MVVFRRLPPVDEIAGDHDDVGPRVEPVHRRHGARQKRRGVDPAVEQRARRDGYADRRAGRRSWAISIGRSAIGRPRLPRQHEHALLGQQIGEAAARIEREGRPCRSSVTLRSMRAPISSHSSTKSRIVQRWMFGVSYQGWSSSSGTGMRPRHSSARRMRQMAEIGERHDRRAGRCAAARRSTCRGLRASPARSGTGRRSRRRRSG